MVSDQNHCTKHYKYKQDLNMTVYEDFSVIEGIDSCWSLDVRVLHVL